MPTSAALLFLLLAGPGAAAPAEGNAGAAPAAPRRAELVERVLAVVDGRPLLLSDARAMALVRGVSLGEALELLIDETLMYEQASQTPQAVVASTEEQAVLADLLQRYPLLATGSTKGALSRLLRRQLAILKYVDFRFAPQVRPTEEELQGAYASEYGARPEAPALETVAEALRARLARQKIDARVEAWSKELRFEAVVRYVSFSN